MSEYIYTRDKANGNSFMVDFDMKRHMGIAPKDTLSDIDNIINYKDHKAGNIEKCVWAKQLPDESDKGWKEREVQRILRDGAWIAIKDEVLWLPPNYYFALQYGRAGADNIQFRLKRLKHFYFKIAVRNNPRNIGTYTVKNRQDGETTAAITDAFWECLDGNLTNGQIGIQSKTRNDAFNPCWRTMQMLWQGIPKWLKEILCSDFVSGDKIAEKMQFMREADDYGHNGRNVLMTYFPSVHNAMDGLNNMAKCILDEVNKWKECSFYDTFTNYKKFILPGSERKGLFDIFSSPADVNGRWNDEAYEFWKGSDPDKITETGTTSTRVVRYYSNPLEGIQGMYDAYGDANPERIYEFIMRERRNCKPDRLMGEIRGYPLNEEEMFGSFDNSSIWDNHRGLSDRKIYIMGRRFKDDETKEPVCVYGNLEWRGGVMDTDVEFRQSDKDSFDLHEARFCFSYLPQNKEPLRSAFTPPKYVENCLGVDPYNNRYSTKSGKGSNAGAVNHKFADLFQTGIAKVPTMIYDCRPHHQDIFFEDMIKAAVFNRALVQYENRSDKLANYFEDRGYFNWLLPEIGSTWKSNRRGDSPSGKGKFLAEGISIINVITNVPLREGEPYLLLKHWLIPLLDDLLKFNPKDTEENHLTMAWIQALVGAAKILYRKVRERSPINDGVLKELLG